jgi:hypothetical protein
MEIDDDAAFSYSVDVGAGPTHLGTYVAMWCLSVAFAVSVSVVSTVYGSTDFKPFLVNQFYRNSGQPLLHL